MTYPKWIQRTPDLGPILAVNEEEEAQFSGDAETGADADTIHTLRAKLDAAGVSYDKRFGVERLSALLPKE